MLLILIKLKEAYPDVIESFMKDEVSILQSPVLLPKERELLLRLLISYLPPSAVLSVIQNSSSSSSASIIHSLCHLPVDVLLEEYLSVESGLLNTDDSLVVDSIVDLLIAIARHASHFQRIQLIQILFKRMHKSKKNTAAFLQCVSSLLENTYYITSSSEQELLVQFAQEEALREPSLRVLSLCVLPTMSDVKSVGEATHTTQLQWVGQSLLCSSSSVSITHAYLQTNTQKQHKQVQIAQTVHVLHLLENVRRGYASRPLLHPTDRHVSSTHLRQLVQTLDLREARAAHHVANHRLARDHLWLLRRLPVPLHCRALRVRRLRLPTPHSPPPPPLQRARTAHVAAHAPTHVHADHALEGVRAAVVHLEARRRQRVGEQVVQREPQLARVPIRHQRVLQLLCLRLTPHRLAHRLLVVAAVHALLHLLRLTPVPCRDALHAHAQHAQVVEDRHVLHVQLACLQQRLQRLPRRRRQLLRDRVDQHQTDLALRRHARAHLVLLTTPHTSPPHSPQILPQQLLQLLHDLLPTPHAPSAHALARTARRLVEARHHHLLLRLTPHSHSHQRDALVQRAVLELLHAHARHGQVQREQVLTPLVLRQRLDQVADVLDRRLRLTRRFRSHLALLRGLQEPLCRRAEQRYALFHSSSPTARVQNVLVLVVRPDRVVVVQQHLARLRRALRPVLELRLTPAPFSYFTTLADGQQVHRHGLCVSGASRTHLVVDGVQQRHQRVERARHQQQLPLLVLTPPAHHHLAQHRLVVGDVLQHLRLTPREHAHIVLEQVRDRVAGVLALVVHARLDAQVHADVHHLHVTPPARRYAVRDALQHAVVAVPAPDLLQRRGNARHRQVGLLHVVVHVNQTRVLG